MVSVIIPTIGRPELNRAIQSVRAQAFRRPIEVVVVVDLARESTSAPVDVEQIADQVIWTGGGRRGSFARNAGVRASRGGWIAFLDDDDEWEPNKLHSQFACLARAGDPHRTVVASRHIQVDVKSGRISAALPVKLIAPGQKPEEYLFRKRRPAGGRASMYTSTLLCSRDLADAVRWDENLPRHQDWDWLIRAGQLPGVQFIQAADPLVRIQTGSVSSISAGTSWQDSLAWADKAFVQRGSAVTADFLAGQPLRYALGARSSKGVRECLMRLRRNRRFPAFGPLLIAAGGLLPRRWIERLMTVIR